MNTNDFRLTRNGSLQQLLAKDALVSMQAIDQRGPDKQSALLMLHGYSSTPAVFKRMIPQLNRYDAIVAPILPGHAEDLDRFSQIKAQNWLDYTRKQCETLLNTYTRVDVLGFSLGGVLAHDLGQRYPLNHLYLLAPAFDLCVSLSFYLRLSKLLKALGFYALYNSGANIISPDYLDITYRELPLATIIELFSFIKNVQWKPTKCLTDLFLGKYDRVVNVNTIGNRFINDPNTTIHWLAHSGHVLPLDNDVYEIIECMNISK